MRPAVIKHLAKLVVAGEAIPGEIRIQKDEPEVVDRRGRAAGARAAASNARLCRATRGRLVRSAMIHIMPVWKPAHQSVQTSPECLHRPAGV